MIQLEPESLILENFDQKPYSYCYGVSRLRRRIWWVRRYKNLLSGCSAYTKNYETNEMEKIGTIVVSIDPYELSIKLDELEGC
jgi:hypothetical protein